MRIYPESESDREEVELMKAEQWQVDALKMNPDYVFWGPYEDYMANSGSGWDSCLTVKDWRSFDFPLDKYNEVVNFYFEVDRTARECYACNGYGYNERTKIIRDNFHQHSGYPNEWVDIGWSSDITAEEVEALAKAGRLGRFFEDDVGFDKENEVWKKKVYRDGRNVWEVCDKPEMPTPEEVNQWNKGGLGHDAINRLILVKARAESLGVYGLCPNCGGSGSVYIEPKAKLGLVLWILHPRKGCSRGVHVEEIKKEEVGEVVEYLKTAARRNADRFGRLK